jgi:hypothetical protein
MHKMGHKNAESGQLSVRRSPPTGDGIWLVRLCPRVRDGGGGIRAGGGRVTRAGRVPPLTRVTPEIDEASEANDAVMTDVDRGRPGGRGGATTEATAAEPVERCRLAGSPVRRLRHYVPVSAFGRPWHRLGRSSDESSTCQGGQR